MGNWVRHQIFVVLKRGSCQTKYTVQKSSDEIVVIFYKTPNQSSVETTFFFFFSKSMGSRKKKRTKIFIPLKEHVSRLKETFV